MCNRCRSPNSDSAKRCGECGQRLGTVAEPQSAQVAEPQSAQVAEPPKTQVAVAEPQKTTLQGLASGAPTDLSASTPVGDRQRPTDQPESLGVNNHSPTANAPSKRQTLLGIRAPESAQSPALAVDAVKRTDISPSQTMASGSSSPKTLMGLSSATEIGGEAPSSYAREVVASPPSTHSQPARDTGVKGSATTSASPANGPYQPPKKTVRVAAPSQADLLDAKADLFDAAVLPSSRWSRRSQGKLIVAVAVLLLLTGGAIAVLLDPAEPLAVRLLHSADGAESLSFSCEDCPDNTRLTLGVQSVTVLDHQAEMTTSNPLQLGVNTLNIHLERPGVRKSHAVTVEVVVPYRISVDFAGIDEELQLPVTVQALPGTTIALDTFSFTVGSEPVELDLDLTEALEGTARETGSRLSQEHPFTVTHAAHGTVQGVVNLDVPIAPLTLTAPGERIVVTGDRFRLAGVTSTEAMLSANGNPIPIDSNGSFNQLMGISRVGETLLKLVVKKPGHAPRRMNVAVKRVASLHAEAKRWSENRPTRIDDSQRNYQLLAAKNDAAKEAPNEPRVTLRGRVQDTKTLSSHAVSVLDIPGSCESAPCLVRVRHSRPEDAGHKKLTNSQWINVFGQVASSEENSLPTVQAEFMIPE